MDLKYEGIPDKVAHVFATAVINTLEKLGCKFEYDEHSLPNDKGESDYRVANVRLPKPKGKAKAKRKKPTR